jgi:hypothetical protein
VAELPRRRLRAVYSWAASRQAPAQQRKEEPIIVRRVEEIDHDQKRIRRDIDEEVDEKPPLGKARSELAYGIW